MNNVRAAGYRLFDPCEDKGPIFLREIGFSLTMESTCSWRRDVFDSTCKTWPFSFERKPIDLWLSKCYYYKLYLSNRLRKRKGEKRSGERRGKKVGKLLKQKLKKKKKSATRKVSNVFLRTRENTPVSFFLSFLHFSPPKKLLTAQKFIIETRNENKNKRASTRFVNV